MNRHNPTQSSSEAFRSLSEVTTAVCSMLVFILFLGCANPHAALNSAAQREAAQRAHTTPEQPPREASLPRENAPRENVPDRLQVLYFGDDGHHEPAKRLRQVLPAMAEAGIFLTYTEDLEDLRPERLGQVDVVMFYGNKPRLSSQQEKALLDFVAEGGGVVAIHSASASFGNSDAYVNLIGAAFEGHGTGTFQTKTVKPDHPALQGVPSFESWDETYVHMKHNPDKTVLSVREEEGREEPWTWVRTQGAGRVFYTAWGHDERTWSKPGFKKLLAQGTRWAAGDWALAEELAPPALEYVEGDGILPYYPEEAAWGVTGEPITKLQKPLRPASSMQQMSVQPGFRVEPFASDPSIVNPIDMTWDERGRLWVVETVDYPNQFEPRRRGQDRIKIVEDTDGDGQADTFTVFADSLNLPTSLTLARGGVIVAQAPEVLFLKDTDGDDKADVEKVLFSGFGTYDTHAGPSNLQYGFDNRIWGAVGYSGFNGAVNGDSIAFGQGFYRFPPDGSELNYMATTNNNTWGLGFDEQGLVFGSTANDNPAVHMAIPNRFYRSVRGWGAGPILEGIADTPAFYPITDRVRQVDQHGRYTSGAGFQFYTARDFPEEYWNRVAFVSGPTGHLLGKFAVEPEGSGFVARNQWNMLASRDEWVSPIQAKVGPDGALWVIDWYNLVIQHNPVPEGFEKGEGNAYETQERDREHSRIYRIVYEGNEPEEERGAEARFSLEEATPEALVQALTHENMFWRLTAQRLLVERGRQDVLPALYKLVQKETTNAVGLNPGVIHALWTMQGLGALDGANEEALKVATNALYHPSSGVRRTALHVLPRTAASREEILQTGILPRPTPSPSERDYTVPASAMHAADAQVRLASLLALAEMPADEQAGAAVAKLLQSADITGDRWMMDAATAAGAQHDTGFLAHKLRDVLPSDADSAYVANVSGVVQAVSHHYAMGTPEKGAFLPILMATEEAEEAFADALLEGLAAGWPEGGALTLSEEEQRRLQSLRSALSDEQAGLLEKLADRWGVPEARGE